MLQYQEDNQQISIFQKIHGCLCRSNYQNESCHGIKNFTIYENELTSLADDLFEKCKETNIHI